MEIGFAHVLNQKVFLLNPIPDIPYYKIEIVAVQPIILNGDLSKVEPTFRRIKQVAEDRARIGVN